MGAKISNFSELCKQRDRFLEYGCLLCSFRYATFATDDLLSPPCESLPVGAFHKVEPFVFLVVASPRPRHESVAELVAGFKDYGMVSLAVEIVLSVVAVVAEFAYDEREFLLMAEVELLAYSLRLDVRQTCCQ